MTPDYQDELLARYKAKHPDRPLKPLKGGRAKLRDLSVASVEHWGERLSEMRRSPKVLLTGGEPVGVDLRKGRLVKLRRGPQ